MQDAKHVTIDLDAGEYEALASIAAFEHRSPAEIAVQALRHRIEHHRVFAAAVAEGLDDIRSGQVVTHDIVMADISERRARRRQGMSGV